MTKALHRKRPELIPMLDSVVQGYLVTDGAETAAHDSFGEQGIALVRSYKGDLDRNVQALSEIKRDLSSRGLRLSEVRILDIAIWSALAQT
jgi:hypothetical protein